MARNSLLVLVCLVAGCTGPAVTHRPDLVPLRPDGSPGPEKCPEKALEAMRLLQLKMDASAVVEIDMNQDMQSPISVNDGPIESMLNERLGFFSIGTRLYGYVWTGGPNANVTIRYYEARPMGGNRVPICAVARASQANMRKLPGSKPGNAILEFSRTAVWLVDEFR